MTIFNYTERCIINKKHEITEVPFHLEQFIFEDNHSVTTLISNVNSQLTSLTLNDNFFSINYNKGGMISLKEVRRHPKWKQEYEQLVETKYVHICKSCESKAYAGCCSGYSVVNRKKVKMVLGWSG
jgi:hypothetical protein